MKRKRKGRRRRRGHIEMAVIAGQSSVLAWLSAKKWTAKARSQGVGGGGDDGDGKEAECDRRRRRRDTE